MRRAPYFDIAREREVIEVRGARVLALLGDFVTTDHISPAGAIAADSPAARYLGERGVERSDFNTYGSRRGNHEIMKLGQYESAASAYGDALKDSAYGRRGALSCNRGRALLASGHTADAIGALSSAVQDSSYATPYKAYLALGSAYEKSGDIRNAGIAYRNAAIDEGNPNPSGALRSLGSCFMRLGRPVDAVEAYRTGLDFTTPLESQNQIYCDLGLAYVASNRMLTGSATGQLALTLISTSQTVEVGDIVVTSGLGGVFPKGLPLGKVTSVENNPGSLYLDIIVEPFSTYGSYEEVLVITSLTEGQQASSDDIAAADAQDTASATSSSTAATAASSSSSSSTTDGTATTATGTTE